MIDAFKDFKEEKSIDRPVMLGVLKDVFLTQLAKTYGSADNFDVIINVDKGDCEIYQNFEVVEEVENPATEITVEEIAAETGDDDYEIGDTYTRKLSLSSFGRRGILNIRQNLQGRIMDIEKANVFKKYSGKVGEIFTGEVYQTWKNEVLILDEDGNELRMPKSEQIPGERFKKNDTIRAIIKSVEMKNNTTPYIVLSRTTDSFLEKLFEMEVPEIYDGLITVKKVVRIPGERAKVAVESYDDRIDPIGACIGVKGSRIMGIVRELRNENIDVIQWTANTQLMITRALNPARISRIDGLHAGRGSEEGHRQGRLQHQARRHARRPRDRGLARTPAGRGRRGRRPPERVHRRDRPVGHRAPAGHRLRHREERPRPRAGRHRQPRRPGGRDRGRGLLHPEVRIRGRIN